MKRPSLRVLAVLASIGLLGAALAAPPAHAGKKKAFACAPATAPVPTEGHSSNADEAAEAEVINLTAAATEEAPVKIEYEHGAAIADARMEDTKYFAFQVVSKTPGAGVYIKQEWPGGESDMDLYLYDSGGAEVASSGAFNPAPIDAVVLDFTSGGNGGSGYESIPGFPADPCSPYTVESRAYLTPGESMTLSFWLGEAGDTYTRP